ncbi:EamA/RhaT family transporter, partial [Rhodococcus erythropolis]|nr:EamA/RhaT family transporter [Rhodococcus erythropolis]
RRAVVLQVLGGLLLGLDFALWSQSILMIGAGMASVVVNVQVIVVPALSWLVFGNRVPMRFVFALPFMFTGIALA